MVLVARGRTLTAPWKELNDTFLRLCRKLELLQDQQGSQNAQAKQNRQAKHERQKKQENRGTKKQQPDEKKFSVKGDRSHAPEKAPGTSEDKP